MPSSDLNAVRQAILVLVDCGLLSQDNLLRNPGEAFRQLPTDNHVIKHRLRAAGYQGAKVNEAIRSAAIVRDLGRAFLASLSQGVGQTKSFAEVVFGISPPSFTRGSTQSLFPVEVQKTFDAVASSPYHPSRIMDRDVQQARSQIEELLSFSNLLAAFFQRIRMSRDLIMVSDPVIQEGLRKYGGGIEIARQLFNQAQFIRRPMELDLVTSHLIPSLRDRGRSRIVIGDIGPGFEHLPNAIPGRSYFSSEPLLLRALGDQTEVHLYDLSPESLQATKEFLRSGEFVVRAAWRYSDADNERISRFNPYWKDHIKRAARYYEALLVRAGATEVAQTTYWHPDGGLLPINVVRFPLNRFENLHVHDPTDITVGNIGDELFDFVSFHVHGYLDAGQPTDLFSLAALIRLVHQVRPGGYILIDKRKLEGQVIVARHSPDPPRMQCLGLDAVAMTNAETPTEDWIVFRKSEANLIDGRSNAFVTDHAGRVEAVRRFLPHAGRANVGLLAAIGIGGSGLAYGVSKVATEVGINTATDLPIELVRFMLPQSFLDYIPEEAHALVTIGALSAVQMALKGSALTTLAHSVGLLVPMIIGAQGMDYLAQKTGIQGFEVDGGLYNGILMSATGTVLAKTLLAPLGRYVLPVAGALYAGELAIGGTLALVEKIQETQGSGNLDNYRLTRRAYDQVLLERGRGLPLFANTSYAIYRMGEALGYRDPSIEQAVAQKRAYLIKKTQTEIAEVLRREVEKSKGQNSKIDSQKFAVNINDALWAMRRKEVNPRLIFEVAGATNDPLLKLLAEAFDFSPNWKNGVRDIKVVDKKALGKLVTLLESNKSTPPMTIPSLTREPFLVS